MHPMAIRRFLHFLLITLLVNAGGWTFNREAVADVFLVGEETAIAGTVHSSQQASHQGELPKAEMPCNHWCHAVGHFLGLFGQTPVLLPEPASVYCPQFSRFIPEPSPEDLFRPPRLLS